MNLPPLILNAPPLLDANVSSEREAITRTAELLRNCPEVTDAAGFLAAVLDRQRINSPVLENGVALPHARTTLVREIVCVAARCKEAVPFGAALTPVRLIFLFGIPPHRINQYLAATAALVKRLRDPAVLEGLLAAQTTADFQGWLA